MREIKFRAWDIKDKIMVYQDNVDYLIGYDGFDLYLAKEEYYGGDLVWATNEDVKFMQYTRLKDKNGKEIYEGDICKVSGEEYYVNDYFTTDYDWEMIMYIDFSYGAFQFREKEDKHMSIYFIETDDMDIEVIGNIFENQELLQGE